LHPLTSFLSFCKDDILCTKKRCAFIFLQSTMIRAVSDMAVNEETITSAACEEVSGIAMRRTSLVATNFDRSLLTLINHSLLR